MNCGCIPSNLTRFQPEYPVALFVRVLYIAVNRYDFDGRTYDKVANKFIDLMWLNLVFVLCPFTSSIMQYRPWQFAHSFLTFIGNFIAKTLQLIEQWPNLLNSKRYRLDRKKNLANIHHSDDDSKHSSIWRN